MEITRNKNKKKIALRLLKKNPQAYFELSKEDKLDQDISLAFIKYFYNYCITNYIYAKDFFSDKQKEKPKYSFLQYIKAIPKELKENKDFSLKALERNSLYFLSIEKSIKKDVEILREFFKYTTKEDLKFLKLLKEQNKDFHHFLMLSFKNNNMKDGDIIDYIIPQNYRNSKKILLEISKEIKAYNYDDNLKEEFYNCISSNLKKDKIFNLKLINNNPDFIEYFNEELKEDREIIKQILISGNSHCLKKLPETILNDNINLTDLLTGVNYIHQNLLGKKLVKELRNEDIDPSSPKEIVDYLNKKILMLDLTEKLNVNKEENIIIKKMKI